MRKYRAATAILITLFFALLLALPASAGAAPSTPRSSSGIGNWVRQVAGGFGKGKANATVMAMAELGGKLFAGVSNDSGCIVMGKTGAGWTAASTPGFGNANNKSVMRMAVFSGKLYAGTMNDKEGCSVWRYDGPGPANWTDVSAVRGPGLGNANNLAVGSMAVFGGRLYVGTANFSMTTFGSQGGEIYSYDGGTWASEMTGGFGDTQNAGITSMSPDAHGTALFAGTARIHLALALIDFGHVKVTLTSPGCELWRMTGATWASRTKVGANGFSDTRNLAVTALGVYAGKLYVGTANVEGSAVYDVAAKALTDFTYSSSGLCIYYYNGASPVPVVRGGFDSIDDVGAVAFQGATVAGKDLLLVGVLNTAGTGKLKAYDGADWFSAADNGMGNAGNAGIVALASSGSTVYAGTANSSTGCEIWAGTPPSSKADISKTWYLAEGCTNGGFETWVLIQNPGASAATAQVTYMTPAGEKAGPAVHLAPRSRQSINVADTVPSEWSVSTRIDADQPVVAERAMYWNNRRAGHDSIGVTGPSTAWYLAEGSTDGGFETWVLIQNPGSAPAKAVLTYMTGSGQVEGPTIDLPPRSRQSVNVADKVPGQWTVSTKVTSDQPVIAERAVYWNNRSGGHDSIGVTSASSTWYLAEGSTDGGFETWIAIQNPGGGEASATLTFMTPAGSVPGPVVKVPAYSRVSVDVGKTVPAQYDVSTKVTADRPVIAERAVYWNNRVEGHDSVGVTSASATWYMAEGSTAGGFETWVLIQNPGDTETTADVVFMTPTGEVQGPKVTLKAHARTSINVADTVPGNWSVSTKVTAGHPVICERSVYWSSRTGGTNSIGAVI